MLATQQILRSIKGCGKKKQLKADGKYNFQFHPQDNYGFAQQLLPQILRRYKGTNNDMAI